MECNNNGPESPMAQQRAEITANKKDGSISRLFYWSLFDFSENQNL